MNGSTRKLLLYLVALIALVAFVVFGGTAPRQEVTQGTQTWGQETLPKADFDHPPKAAFSPDDYFFKLDQLEHFYRVPGEFGYRLMGENYGFEALSFIITETQPNGGPNLHVHDVEEARAAGGKRPVPDRRQDVHRPGSLHREGAGRSAAHIRELGD
jgi:hypothetical protein